jgi:Xaa-Pro aminopeptidase
MPGGLTSPPLVAPPHAARLAALRGAMAEAHLGAIVVSRTAAKRYLAGFVLQPGEEPTAGYAGTLVVTADAAVLLADARYAEQARSQCPGWDVHVTTTRIGVEVSRVLGGDVARCGAEATVLSHADWNELAKALPHAELVSFDAPLAALRLRKDPGEVAAIERACALTDACFAHLLAWVRPGMSERSVAWEIERFFREAGADGLAFAPAVLVGERASMPHGCPTDAPLRTGAALLLDFGCQVDGYRSDMTRTVWLGEPTPADRERHALVRAAQQAAYDTLAVGVSGRAVDGAARELLAEAGLGEAFTHGLGHGIGLETHEDPLLRTWDRPLEAGMTFTLEPGVYLAGEAGIRLEDDVLLETDGPRWLTTSNRDMIVI